MLITFTAAFAIEFVGQFLLFRILSFGKMTEGSRGSLVRGVGFEPATPAV